MNDNTTAELRIDVTPPPADAGRVAEVMAPYVEMLGRAPGGLQMLAASPPLLEHYAANIGYYMGHPRLSQPLLTFIRYLVSWRGDCDYCIDLNEAFLLNAGLDRAAIEAAREDPARAPLAPPEQALLQLAVEAVDHPEVVSEARLAALRELGWQDRDILDAVWHATQNRAFGRTAEAFGLPVDGFAA